MIRYGNKHDIETIIELLKGYRDEAPVGFIQGANDRSHIEVILGALFAGAGTVILAFKDSQEACGMIIGILNPNVWDPKFISLQELAFWVRPEDRGSSIAYRLITKFIEHGNELKEQGKISHIFMNRFEQSKVSYERLGFTKIEETWML